MPKIIRSAVLEDENEVVELWRSCGLVASYNDPGADFRFAIAGSSSAVIVAQDGCGDICGAVMVGHDGHRGWLYYVAASPDRRREGIGRTMIEAAEQWLRDRDVPKVQLMIRETNAPVASFYERLGYEDAPRILMAKWLNRSK
ncbi:GNAT family acetyltransferase [Sphingobium phenoxybenzoativorans]|uniref:GNAT family acetyltransferase n=1 Tax=Sphingobium phenoxybenzoativorans TaxID=1592790 RepID=UPI000871C80B|nr:GNAT family acetyltransferase [Sphingobium phenoxybenzoativorans]